MIMPSHYVFPGIGQHSKDLIVKKVAEYYGIKTVDLYRKTREREFVEPRQLATSIMKYACGMTHEDLSFEFRQSNGTIWHAKNTVINLYSSNSEYRNRVNEIMEILFPFAEERESILAKMLDPDSDKLKLREGRKVLPQRVRDVSLKTELCNY